MVRVKRGNVARKRRNKILKLAKWFCGAHSSLFRIANQQVIKSLLYAYNGRKKKRESFVNYGLKELMPQLRLIT